jgi:two-component system sensor histidine kinase HydH
MHGRKDRSAAWLSGALLAAVLILVALFSVMAIRDYGRESTFSRQTLLEKGSVLIRALASGTRVGMGMQMHHAQQQTLLEAMAGQPGVLWFAVTDAQGGILTHSDPRRVGSLLYSPQEMRQLHPNTNEQWRSIDAPDPSGKMTPALEIYSLFQPLFTPGRHGMRNTPRYGSQQRAAIFIAFDASDVASTQARERR